MRVWRAVSDILPSKNVSSWVGWGIYGEGTYFRPELRKVVSFDGDEAVNWEVITEFEISAGKLVHINDENTSGLDSDVFFGKKGNPLFEGKAIRDETLGALVKKAKFDAIMITGQDVDGGNQVFIPKGKTLASSKTVSHTIIFKNKAHAELLANSLQLDFKRGKYGWEVHFPNSKTKTADKTLKPLLVGKMNKQELTAALQACGIEVVGGMARLSDIKRLVQAEDLIDLKKFKDQQGKKSLKEKAKPAQTSPSGKKGLSFEEQKQNREKWLKDRNERVSEKIRKGGDYVEDPYGEIEVDEKIANFVLKVSKKLNDLGFDSSPWTQNGKAFILVKPPQGFGGEDVAVYFVALQGSDHGKFALYDDKNASFTVGLSAMGGLVDALESEFQKRKRA